MPNERAISQMMEIFTDVIDLGGVEERTAIVPNLSVIDAAPAGLTNFIIIQDDRDGDNILAKTVPGVIYANNDKVNVLFIRGGEPIAFQQGSQSSNAGLWEIVPSTSTDIFYNRGDVGIGKSVAPDATLEILDTAQAQLRLTHTEDTKFVDFTLDTNHDLTIKPSSTGQIIFQPTTDSVDFFQVLDADGGTPILNVDSTNERVGIGVGTPASRLDVNGDMLLSGGSQNYLFTDRGSTLILQSQTASTAFALEMFPFDGDGTDDNNFSLYAVGAPSNITNRERLLIKYEATGTQFEIFSEADGTGTLRPLIMYTEGNSSQVYLETDGNVGIGTAGPDAKLDILATTTQLRLTHTDGSKFVDFTLDTNHDLTVTPSSTGQIIFQPTTDSVDFFQVLDADGGDPVLNVDTVNERVGIGSAAPNRMLLVEDSSTGSTITTIPLITARNTNTVGNSLAGYTMEADNGAIAGQFFADGNDLFGFGTDSIYFRVATAHPLIFGTSNTPRGSFTTGGNFGSGTLTADAKIESQSTTNTQLRLTFQDSVKFVDFDVDTNHDLTITPSSTGQIILQPTTDSTDFFQVLDADGGTPVLNVDSTNERVGIGVATPGSKVDITGAGGGTSGLEFNNSNESLLAYFETDLANSSFFVTYVGSSAAEIVIENNGDVQLARGGNVAVGGNFTPTAKLHVDQASTTGAIPVAMFDQADVSEEMFEFATTIGVGNAIEAVGAKTLTTTHFVKVTIPGGLTRYFPVGTIA